MKSPGEMSPEEVGALIYGAPDPISDAELRRIVLQEHRATIQLKIFEEA